MIRLVLIAATTAVASLTTGCASIVSGQNQSLSVATRTAGADVSGAKCSLLNDKGTWYLTTPGSVTVRRSFSDLTVNCAIDGQDPGISMIKSSTKAMALGNIIFGGVIGAGVDMSTGAAYDYPELIVVTLGQVGPTAERKPAPAAAAVPAMPPTAAGVVVTSASQTPAAAPSAKP